jgi:glycosyltransferase involved in cell wall biosynthesis
VYRNPVNKGLAGCWNTCLERSRGEWVHLLHQDDLVLPGFYQRLREGIMVNPKIGAAFCRHAFISSDGRQTLVSRLEHPQAGVFGNIIERLAQNCCVQCASIVVKRSVYEQLGGYSYSLKLALDWEMWLRIAGKFPVWYEPVVLACYRLHAGSESGRLAQTGQDLVETRLMLEQAAKNLEARQGRKILAEAKTSYALNAVSNAERFLYRSSSGSERNLKAGWNQITGAIRMRPSFPVILAVGGVLLRVFRAGVHRVFGSRPSVAKR